MDFKSIKTAANITPGENNPRNSEGAFLKLDDNRLAFAYSRYEGDSFDDHARCNIAVIYSYDNGVTWDTDNYEILVDAAKYGEKNVMSVSLVRLANQDIGLFFMVKHPGPSSSYYMRRYRGNFDNLLSEVKCFPNEYENYFVVNNDRVLCMSDGTLIIPAAFHHSDVRGIKETGDHFEYRASVFTFSSNDGGETWHQNFGKLHMDDSYSCSGLQEPGLSEIGNGVLYCYSRTDRMYQYESVSLDKGGHWFKAQPSRFSSLTSPMLIKKNPYSGKYYAVWNPVSKIQDVPGASYTYGRYPLVMAQSSDGINFDAPIVIEDDPNRGYCYPAIYFLDENTMLLAYCNGGKEDGCTLNSTIIRRIDL